MRQALIGLALIGLAACEDTPADSAEFEDRLQEVLANRPAGSGAAFAVMKDGMGGPAWLATVHGYADNRSVCEELIKPYNEKPDLSVLPGTYFCREIQAPS